MKKRRSMIILLALTVFLTGCTELKKKPLQQIETHTETETTETETQTEEAESEETQAAQEVFEQGNISVDDTEMATADTEEIEETPDTTPEGELPVPEPTQKEHMLIDMENILQNPELPTGCESVALTMVLKYLGFDLDKTTIADDYLVFGDGNFSIGYMGDPHTEEGAGIFAPGLVKTANDYLETQESARRAFDLSETDFEDLYNYVAAGIPVIVWNTMYLEEPVATDEICEFEGKTYRWFRNEHCMVLCGFDREKNIVYIQDPLDGLVERDADKFAEYYNELGKNAMIVH